MHDWPVGLGLHAVGVRVDVTAGGTKIFVIPSNEVIVSDTSGVELDSGIIIVVGVKAELWPDVEDELLHSNVAGESCRLTIKSFFPAGLKRGREDFGSFLLATSRTAMRTRVSIRTANSA